MAGALLWPFDETEMHSILQPCRVARNLLGARDASALERLDTIYVVDQEGNILNRSAAVAFVMRRLGWPWSWAGLLVGVLPGCIRDFLYGVVARNRYLFGVCQLGYPHTAHRISRWHSTSEMALVAFPGVEVEIV